MIERIRPIDAVERDKRKSGQDLFERRIVSRTRNEYERVSILIGISSILSKLGTFAIEKICDARIAHLRVGVGIVVCMIAREDIMDAG